MNTETILKNAAVAGNIIFILWGLYNAIDERFKGTLPEKFSYAGLTGLLVLNSFLLLLKRKKPMANSRCDN